MRALGISLVGLGALLGVACADRPEPACHVARVAASEEVGADAREHFIEALRSTRRFREVNSEGKLSRSPHLHIDLVAYPKPGDYPPGVEHGFGFRLRGPDSDAYIEIDTIERQSVWGELLFSLRGLLFERRSLSTRRLSDALSERWAEIEDLTACIRIQ